MCFITYNWNEEADFRKKLDLFARKPNTYWAYLQITDKCNYNCNYCYQSSDISGFHGEKDKILKIIDNLAKSGIKQLTLTGGEPLLHPEVDAFIKFAHDLEFIVHICSNGTGLNKKRTNDLKKIGVSQIQINVDHYNPDMNAKIRGNTLARNAIEYLRNVKNSGMTSVATINVTQTNKNSVLETMKYCRSQGVDRIRIINSVPTGKANSNLCLSGEEYVSLFEKATQYAFEDLKCDSAISFDPNVSYDSDKFKKIPCPQLLGLSLNVDYEGNILFCSCKNQKKLINILKEENYKPKLKKILTNYETSPCSI